MGENDSDMPTLARGSGKTQGSDSEAPTLPAGHITAEDVAAEVERRAALLASGSEPPTLADNEVTREELEAEIKRLLALAESDAPSSG